MVIQARITPPDWTANGDEERAARCQRFPITRDPETGQTEDDAWFKQAEDALPVCNGDYIGTPCPLRMSCLRVSLVNNELYGVWGGMTAPQRRWIRRNIEKEFWEDDKHLRDRVPPPDHFKDLGDEEEDDDERVGDIFEGVRGSQEDEGVVAARDQESRRRNGGSPQRRRPQQDPPARL